MIAAAHETILSHRKRDYEEPRLVIDEGEIRRSGSGHLLRVCWRQWTTERELALKGIGFRTTDTAALEKAYAAMTEEEFDAVNGRQDWANWRTIARSMSGLVPDRPLNIIDLGCGTGGSTRVLAHYAPLGSRITGYELAPPLAAIARRRQYRHRSGRPVVVEICCQGISEPLCDCFDHTLPARSIDLVNASGVVGQHLSFAAAKQLLRELKRILVPGGLAMLDVGRRLSAEELVGLGGLFGLVPLRYSRSSLFDRTGQFTFRNGNLPAMRRSTLRRALV